MIDVNNNRIQIAKGDSGSILLELPFANNSEYVMSIYDGDEEVLVLYSHRVIDNKVEFIIDSFSLEGFEEKQYGCYISYFNEYGERTVSNVFRFVVIKGLK